MFHHIITFIIFPLISSVLRLWSIIFMISQQSLFVRGIGLMLIETLHVSTSIIPRMVHIMRNHHLQLSYLHLPYQAHLTAKQPQNYLCSKYSALYLENMQIIKSYWMASFSFLLPPKDFRADLVSYPDPTSVTAAGGLHRRYVR